MSLGWVIEPWLGDLSPGGVVEVVGMMMTIIECRRARYGRPRPAIDGSVMVPEH